MNDIELFSENELTPIETEERAFHERVIHDAERGKQKLTEIQLASLKVLFDNKLYRSTHKTFPEYCKATFDFEKAYSYYQLGFAQIKENLSTMVDFLPENERQARPLAKLLTPELQAQAWTQAQTDSGKEQPSNREVAEAVAKVQAELEAATQRCEEFRQESNERRKKVRELEEQIDLLTTRDRMMQGRLEKAEEEISYLATVVPEPEKVVVAPDDYESAKAEAAKLRQQLADIEARKDQLVQQQVIAKLKEREHEIAALDHQAEQLKGTITSYQAHIAKVHLPELEMQQQLKAVEDFMRACAGLAASLALFEHAPNPATAAVWQKGIAAATDAAHAMRLHTDRRPELTVIRGEAA